MDANRIRDELSRIRRQLHRGDESELWVWVIQDTLACAQRPLRDHITFGGRNPLRPEAKALVEAWVERVIRSGFRSIISLLEEAQLDRYYVRGGIGLHPKGLLGYYESRKLSVESVPCQDYQRPTAEQMLLVLDAFGRLPKPILLHCSAGIDRTAPVAAFLVENSKLVG